jgi:SAM hydroxide adenosyltransferase N-terminal domain
MPPIICFPRPIAQAIGPRGARPWENFPRRASPPRPHPAYPRADAPVGNPEASAYLLAAYAEWFPEDTVFLCVVDPRRGRDAPAYS